MENHAATDAAHQHMSPGAVLAQVRELRQESKHEQALALLRRLESSDRLEAWLMRADSVFEVGQHAPQTVLLEESITAWQYCLKLLPTHASPEEQVRLQCGLADALFVLGGCESGAERLLVAVAAYRDALQYCSLQRAPLHWGLIFYNLGAALYILGVREADPALLE